MKPRVYTLAVASLVVVSSVVSAAPPTPTANVIVANTTSSPANVAVVNTPTGVGGRVAVEIQSGYNLNLTPEILYTNSTAAPVMITSIDSWWPENCSVSSYPTYVTVSVPGTLVAAYAPYSRVPAYANECGWNAHFPGGIIVPPGDSLPVYVRLMNPSTGTTLVFVSFSGYTLR